MGPVEPIGSPPPVTPPLRVTRERREREADDRGQQPPRERSPEPPEERDEDAEGHIDVTV
jgi:hypothetical protein